MRRTAGPNGWGLASKTHSMSTACHGSLHPPLLHSSTAQYHSCHTSLMHNSLCLLSLHVHMLPVHPHDISLVQNPLLRTSLIPSIISLQEGKLSLSHCLPFADLPPMGRVHPLAQCPALRGPEHHAAIPPTHSHTPAAAHSCMFPRCHSQH